MNMPAPILTTTAALVFRLNLQWYNHVLAQCHSFRCTAMSMAYGESSRVR